MIDLSPLKLLVVLVVALLVLGPEKLPSVTRQIGKAWGELTRLREGLRSQVKDAVGDLPEMAGDLRGARDSFYRTVTQLGTLPADAPAPSTAAAAPDAPAVPPAPAAHAEAGPTLASLPTDGDPGLN